MADFKNHRRVLVKCLSKDIIPVSVELRSNIKIPRGLNTIKKVERALLNERIRTVNNTLDMLECHRDTYMNKLSIVLDHEAMEESKSFINCIREARHNKTLECQKSKFERLWMKNKGGCSNKNSNMYGYHSGKILNSRQRATTKTAPSTTSNWVINMSSNH